MSWAVYWAAPIGVQDHPSAAPAAHEHRPLHRGQDELGAHVIVGHPSARRECSSRIEYKNMSPSD